MWRAPQFSREWQGPHPVALSSAELPWQQSISSEYVGGRWDVNHMVIWKGGGVLQV